MFKFPPNVWMLFRGFSGLFLVIALASCQDALDEPVGPPDTPQASAVALDARGGTEGPRHIVRFTDDFGEKEELSQSLLEDFGSRQVYNFERVFNGVVFENLPPAAVEALRRNPNVRYVIEDGVDEALDPTDNWGLDRIDELSGPVSSPYSYNWQFDGSGSHIYIIDTGILGTHDEFAGRLGNGAVVMDYPAFLEDPLNPNHDQDGHGTMAASMAAGNTTGASRGATLHSVRANDDGDAEFSDMINAFEWVQNNASFPAVVNYSYQGDNQGVADAIASTIGAGITVVKGAGNDGVDACDASLSNQVSGVIVVGATNKSDQIVDNEYWASNWGACVILFAPGRHLVGAGVLGGSAYDTVQSGTSFAAPLTAGVAALVLQQRPSYSPHSIRDLLRNSGSPGEVQGFIGSAPNRLLDSYHSWAWIEGPSSITSAGDVTWQEDDVGGDGTWSFTWEESINGGAFSVVSTSTSYTKSVSTSQCYDGRLRLTSATHDESFVFIFDYTVNTSGMCVQ